MAELKPLLTYRGVVYPWHCDHVGHMNVMWYAGKFDEASWNFMLQMGVTPSYLRDNGRGMAALEQSTAYLRELMAGDLVEVRTELVELREKFIRFRHLMTQSETGETAATCAVTAVHLDAVLRKACPFPVEVLAAGEALAA